ncbi:lasso peptide biosynthesis PqqD family chaperone [Pseudalkalibacillus caeni]|uniref:lasso peptide biosynthesis PqqD family chaperone n=1 Tax=Exobacillus caeni TaxID=2574798 RepID=UPI001FE28685|nr:lasso peptide biosynthesis PqqD family chaperone [Pseudalkalibacillus caeni]
MKTFEKITQYDVISQTEGNICSDMAGEKVMLSIKNGKYYNLGETGGDIWDMIINPIEVNAIVENLVIQYEVNQEECEGQVLSFLEELLEQDLIKKSK